jgi:hypothetical protein
VAEGSNLGRRIAVIALALAFFAALAVATQREAAVECEVCMVYAGREACRTSSAADRDLAIRGAVSTACAVLSSGVTRGMECDRTPPRSVQCTD